MAQAPIVDGMQHTTHMTHTTATSPIAQVHALTVSMAALASTIERLHPESPARTAALAEYKECKAKAKTIRDSITNADERKFATWCIRTANKPVDINGKVIA